MRQLRTAKVRLASLMLSTFVVLMVLFLIVWVYGGVTGEEFSPQKFTMRQFYYWQIPIVRVQVWPVILNKMGGPEDELAKHIRMNKLHGEVSLHAPRWDICAMEEVGQTSFRGDASILTNYLKQPGAKGIESWLDWSKAHPILAKELWPLVAKLAHEQAYSVVPTVLETARQTEPDQFSGEIQRMAAKECRALGQAEVEGGDENQAARLLRLAAELEAGS